MNNLGLTGRLARFSATRAWFVIGFWLVLLILGGALAGIFGDALTTQGNLTNDPDSARAAELIEERMAGRGENQEVVVISSADSTVDDPAFQATVEQVLTDLRGLDGVVAEATSYYESGSEQLVSDRRTTTLVPVTLAGDTDDAIAHAPQVLEVVGAHDGRGGYEVTTAGLASVNQVINEVTERDIQTGESIGMPIALLALLIVFGTLVAAGLPIILALVSIVVTMGLTMLLGQALDLNILVTNIIFMIGLAVGIDYALFIIHRYREERGRGLSTIEALGRTGDTATKAVFFSGLTVLVALSGLLIPPSSIYRSLGLGAMLVVLVAMLATLTLLPAILALLGGWIERGRVPLLSRLSRESSSSGFWSRVAGVVMRRPIVSVVAVTALLLLAAIPYTRIELGFGGVSTLPSDTVAARAYTTLEREFSGGLVEPVELAVDGDAHDPKVQAAVAKLQAELATDPEFGPPTVALSERGDLTLITVPLAGDPDSEQSYDAIERLRAEAVPAAFAQAPAQVYVGGVTAESVDFLDVVDSYTLVIFAAVLSLSFLLLLMAFRSLIVPIKAILMNLLSVGASYGLLVAVFQLGYGASLLGFQQVDQIEAWLPLIMFTILFGLSMDYHVFLLSRIKERFDETGDNTGSVLYGVQSTARLITGAALIMVAVFTGFAMGELSALQQVGFGLATAILIDATIVRSVLVPATMQLLGRANWYFPNWLNWLPKINIEGARAEPLGGHSGDD